MKYTSTSTQTTVVTEKRFASVVTEKRFALHDAEPRLKKYTKGLNYRPEDLWVTYKTSNGNTVVAESRISGPRILKDGTESDTVSELIQYWFAEEDGFKPFLAIIEANKP